MSKRMPIVLTAVITFIVTMLFANSLHNMLPSSVSDVMDLVEEKYVGDVSNEVLTEGSINGLLQALDDPYSAYLDTESYNELINSLDASYKGIGVEIYMDGDLMRVLSPFEGSPAYEAGIQSGDIIHSVDGEIVTRDNYAQIVSFMRGLSEEGAKSDTFTVTVLRHGKAIDFSLTRENVQIQTIKYREIDDIAYIRISGFDSPTADDFLKVLKTAKSKKGLIIDVRDNPGGLLTSVTEIADSLLPLCDIVYTENKAGEKSMYSSDAECIDLPIVLLINENSASASEILAGALKDNKAATLVGTKTFGKGSVQQIFPLKNGGGVKLTTALYYTPDGYNINSTGISPDVEVTLPEGTPVSLLDDGSDLQLQKAIEILNDKAINNAN